MARMRALDAGAASVAEPGHIFDVADADAERYEKSGLAERVPPAEDPANTRVQIANSIVRGDPLYDPGALAVAGDMDEATARAIVHTQNPDASPEDVPELGGVSADEDKEDQAEFATGRPSPVPLSEPLPAMGTASSGAPVGTKDKGADAKAEAKKQGSST